MTTIMFGLMLSAVGSLAGIAALYEMIHKRYKDSCGFFFVSAAFFGLCDLLYLIDLSQLRSG